MKNFNRFIAASILTILIPMVASAQTAGQSTIGYLTTSCGTAPPPCFVQYGSSIPISGSITATNPSVGTNNTTAPTSSTQIGSQDSSGNLQPNSFSNPIKTTSAPTNDVNGTPSSYTSAAIESGHIINAAPTNAYTIYAESTAAGLLMTFNLTTVPADGAVTPVECIPVTAGSFAGVDYTTLSDRYSTGLSVVFSTGTSCVTKTASATAFFKVRYK